jgi:hypothetical protein
MMRRNPLNPLSLAIIGTVLLVGASFAGPPAKPTVKVVAPDFNREVRPILANYCMKCHGPDEKIRIAGLRLDSYVGATAKLASGKRAIDPVKLESSELLQRVLAHDYRQMPPPLR